MKLVHLTTVPQTLNFFTGQIGMMQRHGFEVHAVSSPGPMLERFCSRENIQGHAVNMPRRITPFRDLRALANVWRVFRRIRPAIVHAHTPKGGLLGMLAASAAGVPVRIFHLHGLPHMTATGTKKKVLKWATAVACRTSDRILCVSNSIRRAAISEGLAPAWKIVVPANGSINGVDASETFNPARLEPGSSKSVRARYGISAGSVVMGFVGRMVRDKGLVELASAWKTLRNEFIGLEWLLVGDEEPHDPLSPAVVEMFRSDPRIHWTGWSDNLPELYGAMDIVVLPTYREGFPVVALEAAAMGLPLVATRVPGCVDAVEPGVTGLLVEPRDPNALADANRTYLLDGRRRLRHGEAARKRVLEHFEPARVWQAVEAEYQQLLRRRGLTIPLEPVVFAARQRSAG